MSKCNTIKDENGVIVGFACQTGYEEDWESEKDIDKSEIIEKKDNWNFKLKSLDPEILLKEFCNGECIAFGNESSGIMTIAKIYKDEESFTKDYKELIDDTFCEEENFVVYFKVYFNPNIIDEDNDGYFIWPFVKELPEGSIEIGEFFGVEYDC